MDDKETLHVMADNGNGTEGGRRSRNGSGLVTLRQVLYVLGLIALPVLSILLTNYLQGGHQQAANVLHQNEATQENIKQLRESLSAAVQQQREMTKDGLTALGARLQTIEQWKSVVDQWLAVIQRIDKEAVGFSYDMKQTTSLIREMLDEMKTNQTKLDEFRAQQVAFRTTLEQIAQQFKRK